MSKKIYTVVEFEDHTTRTIPSIWIFKNSKGQATAYCPPPHLFNTAMKEYFLNRTWNKHQVKILKTDIGKSFNLFKYMNIIVYFYNKYFCY